MLFPRVVLIERQFPDRSIADIGARIHQEFERWGYARSMRRGARIAIGVGSRGISNIAAIVKAVVECWKAAGAEPFVFPAMGSHGAATAAGQADVLAHYGIDQASMGVPIVSSLEVVRVGQTPEGAEVFLARDAFESDGVFLVGRVKWHTDFIGAIESGLCKMMAIGLGKLTGAQRYHTVAYRTGLEAVIRSVAGVMVGSGKVLGGLAIQEGARHETAGLSVVSALNGLEPLVRREEELLAEVKTWMARLPAPEIDVLIVDEMGKNISGAGMDTKVINRGVNGQYNPFPHTPVVQRIFARGLSSNTYHNAVGIGLADVIHDRLLADVDWQPTYLNSLTASTPAAIRTPPHFASDRECLERIAPTVGKWDTGMVTYCRIKNTLALERAWVSENLLGDLADGTRILSEPAAMPFDDAGQLPELESLAMASAVAR
jgi:hypothetical protein